jgi:hypothetical protein
MRKVSHLTLKRVLKSRVSGVRLSQNSELLLFLDLMLFMKKLAQNAQMECERQKGHIISKEHVLIAAKVSNFDINVHKTCCAICVFPPPLHLFF